MFQTILQLLFDSQTIVFFRKRRTEYEWFAVFQISGSENGRPRGTSPKIVFAFKNCNCIPNISTAVVI